MTKVGKRPYSRTHFKFETRRAVREFEECDEIPMFNHDEGQGVITKPIWYLFGYHPN